jgi:hypothetical protein
MAWWTPFAILAGAKTVSTAIQNKSDRKSKAAAERATQKRQDNYYSDLVSNAQRAGFNPLTVLRAGGGMGYSDIAGRVTQPLFTPSPLAAGIDAAASFYASTYRSPHQKEMDKLNKEALRSDINLSRAQTASLQYELKQLMAPPMTQKKLTSTTNVNELSFGSGNKSSASAPGGYFMGKQGFTTIQYPPLGELYTSAEVKMLLNTYGRPDGTTGLSYGEEIDALSTAPDMLQHYGKKYFDKFGYAIPNIGFLSWSARQRYLKGQKDPIKLPEIVVTPNNNSFSLQGGYQNNPHFSGAFF